MRWIKPNLRSSVYSLLGGSPDKPSESVLESQLEDIRQAMLECMGEFGEKHYPQITRRIRYAGDVQGLWYLRGDLMSVLSATSGELAARNKVRDLTTMFEGMLPGGLNSRPSRLTE
jgi:hypothetical protein